MNRKYDGFTLAEVLITLVIIGVIAAMTIPTLINKTNNQEFVSRLKKSYSTFAQATNKIIAEQGSPKADIGGWATSTEAVYNMYKKYLSKVKECGIGTGECFSETFTTQNGITETSTNRYTFVIADGVAVSFSEANFYSDCAGSNGGSSNICQAIIVDLNGSKGPNVAGRDIFSFALKENGLYPSGCENKKQCNGTSSSWGYGCACRVIRENAMNY